MSVELPRLICRRAQLGPVQADLSAPGWQNAERGELRDGVSGAVPKQRAWVRCAWTDDEWRVLFESEDTDAWATYTERDAPLYEEETVEVFVDPAGDLEAYYEFETNVLSAMLDIVFRRSRSGYKGDRSWDCEGLRVGSQINRGLWCAEFAIPFASIAPRPANGSVWRANFCRIDRPSRDGSLARELTAWSPPLRETFHTPERFGFLEFAD
jgi:hypothetical protein